MPLPSLTAVYLTLSPVALLFLLVSLNARPALQPVVSDPYVCRPRSIHASLAQVCAATAPLEPVQLDKLDLATDRHLTSKQCDIVFPGLYKETDRARDYYLARGGLNLSHLDQAEIKGQARAMIYNNRLYVKSYSAFQQGTRTKAALAAINEALTTSLEPVPDIEFVLQTGDTGMLAGAPWVLGRKAKEESLTLMPDYGFFSWPEPGVGSFLEVQDKTLAYEAGLTWAMKIPKLFWRGALMIDLRKEFVDIAGQYKWGAVADLDWKDLNGELLTPEQHCQYKYLGHVEGWAYSGRLKYLQQCRSVVVAHKMKYIQHFHHLFNADPTSPDQNLVIVPGKGFERLPETMQVLLDNDEWSERIANNSFHFYRHWLSPASIDCYWRRLFDRWAEIQNFKPVLDDSVSFNSFILMGTAHWVPF